MKIALYNIGKTDTSYILTGVTDYISRINRFVDFKVQDINALRNTKNLSPDLICKKEGELIIKSIDKSMFVVLLDEGGKHMTSIEFSHWISNIQNQNLRNIAFVTGGAYGFSPEVYQRADLKISLSKMTFTHQMVRLFFVEQLYRAFTLIKGIPYHNE